MHPPPPTSLTDLYFPHFNIATALHRRANTFYIVFPRAYGMANGNKLFAQLNFPGSNDTLQTLPESQWHLNPRFWHREESNMLFDKLIAVEPKIFKDAGLRRKVTLRNGNGVDGEVEERLVEVQLKEEDYCQRCAWCGGWEYSYADSARHRKIKDGPHGHSLYWCGECSKSPNLWSRHWWRDPEKLDDGVYFYCKLP